MVVVEKLVAPSGKSMEFPQVHVQTGRFFMLISNYCILIQRIKHIPPGNLT
jgi:hypothetical protein